MSSSNHDRLTVIRDGEEAEVFNHVTLTTEATHYIRANEQETHPVRENIYPGDMQSGPAPDAITAWVNQWLIDEHRIDAEDHGIEVVDIEADDVEVI